MAKNKSSLVNRSFTCANYGIYVANCVTCHEEYVGQTSINVHWDGHCNAVATSNKLDNAGDKDETTSLRRYTKSLGLLNKPPSHKSYIVTLYNNLTFSLWISVKVNHGQTVVDIVFIGRDFNYDPPSCGKSLLIFAMFILTCFALLHRQVR